MEKPPDFFLTAVGESGPGVDLARVRACWGRGRLGDGFRDDYMAIEVDPAVIGHPYGLGRQDITELVIATRLKGETLFPVSEWPFHVYVFRTLDEAIASSLRSIRPDQVEMIAWAAIHRSRADAEAEVARHPLRYP